MSKASTAKKLSAAVVFTTLGLAVRLNAVTVPYSTSFETTPDSAGQTYTVGALSGQNGWQPLIGEDTSANVVNTTAASGTQSVNITTTGDNNYTDFYKNDLTINPATLGGIVNISFALDHAAPGAGQTTNTDPGLGAVRSAFGLDVLDTSGNIIASLFTIKSVSGQDDLEVTNGGATAGAANTASTTVTGPAGAGRADGVFGVYNMSLNFNNNTFAISVNGNTAASGGFALNPFAGTTIGGIALAADGTGSNTGFFDNFTVVPEPVGASMVGIGTLALLLRRPNRLDGARGAAFTGDAGGKMN